MGLYDRDHRQNDPWKQNQHAGKQLKFNESKGKIEFESRQQEKLKEFKRIWKLDKKKPKNFFSFIPWIAALLLILAVSKEIGKDREAQASSSVPPSSDVTADHPPVPVDFPLPVTSVLSASYDLESAKCPFTMIADKKNYYIKLCDTMRGNKTVAIFFVRAGEELTTKIPSGHYKLKYGAGHEWHGEQELFGSFGVYSESEPLQFMDYGYSTTGHTVSFYSTVDGNFHSKNIGRDSVVQN